MSEPVDRNAILSKLEAELLPLAFVQAMWEGGAAAFDRVDEWSDLDLQVVVDDERVEETAGVIEAALQQLSPIALRYELPRPTWHGHYQVFITLENASPFLMIDLCIMQRSNPHRFLEPQIHGQAVVHFDKCGLTAAPIWDEDAWRVKIRERLESMAIQFDLFQVLSEKEIARGNWLEALAFYQGYTLRPLVEALRIKYSPHHYNFHTRYIHYELPAEILSRLERLYFLPDPSSLTGARKEAEGWFRELQAELRVQYSKV